MAENRDELKKAAWKAYKAAMEMVEDSQKSTLRLIGEQVRRWVEPLADYIKVLEKGPVSEEVGRLQETLTKKERIISSLNFDNDRMAGSNCTRFRRCSECGGLHDSGYVCPCGHDG